MLSDLLQAVHDSGLASHLRGSRWSYPLVNAGHIVGIALLFGAIVPLDLRLAGLWRQMPVPALARVLLPVALAGLVLAVAIGALLFSVRATEYAQLPLFAVKLVVVAVAIANAVLLARLSPLETQPMARLRAIGLSSIALWLAAILCGRMIGYLM